MSFLLGLDIGTSGVKGLLIAADGEIRCTNMENYPLFTPHSGWAEQNPEDWWTATKKCIKGLIQKSKINAGDIKGISFSGQMHSSVFLDKDMEVIRPAILWSDTRTSKQCREIYERAGGLKDLIDFVSNPALEGFTAPKILWLKDNEPANFQKVKLVLLPKDYIRYQLTGEIHTEVSDGAGTLLMDVKEKDWSDLLLKRLGLSREILPPVVDSITVTGKVSINAAQETGLMAGIPVVAGGADNACGAIGSGIIKDGRVMASIGTSGVVVAQTAEPLADSGGKLHLFNHAVPDNWYMMGVMLSAGMSFSWLKEELFANGFDYNQLNIMASEVEPGSEGLIFLPYLYGERTPYADANARGVFFGISGKHQQRHFVRSVMEGVSFGLRDSLELVKNKDVKLRDVRVIGGGARSKVWQQILADIFGHDISLLNVEEGPAFGAAIIAGVGTGVYSSFSEIDQGIVRVTRTISPIEANVRYYNQLYKIYKDLYQSLKKDYKELALLKG